MIQTNMYFDLLIRIYISLRILKINWNIGRKDLIPKLQLQKFTNQSS